MSKPSSDATDFSPEKGAYDGISAPSAFAFVLAMIAPFVPLGFVLATVATVIAVYGLRKYPRVRPVAAKWAIVLSLASLVVSLSLFMFPVIASTVFLWS